MAELWMANGFYLWALTTALVIIALAWLAWNTFAPQPVSAGGGDPGPSAGQFEQVQAHLAAMAEATPLMQATLGRTLQHVGLVRFADAAGAQAFALAVSNARGDGFVISSSVRGGLSAKPLQAWRSNTALSTEEQTALDHARQQGQATL